jgi:hypothetical protein
MVVKFINNSISLLHMANPQLQELSLVKLDDVAAREFLASHLDFLDAEKPQYVFATEDQFKVIIRNENGTDVYGGLSKKPMISFGPFTLSVPGYLNMIDYQGLTLYDHGHIFSGFLDFGEDGIVPTGRRSQHDVPLEDIQWGYDVYGQNHAIYPFGNNGDVALLDRIVSVFRKYGTFEQQQQKKSRRSKPFYDVARHVRGLWVCRNH